MKRNRILAILFSLTMIFLIGAIPASAAERQLVIPQKIIDNSEGENEVYSLSYDATNKTLNVASSLDAIGTELPQGIWKFLIHESTDTQANQFVCLTDSTCGLSMPTYRVFDSDLIRYGKVKTIIWKNKSKTIGECRFTVNNKHQVTSYRGSFRTVDNSSEEISEDKYEYNKNGNISKITNNAVQVDPKGQDPDIKGSTVDHFQYDSQKRLSKISDEFGTIIYSNYSNGFPQKKVTQSEDTSDTTDYQYYTFDSQNRLSSITTIEDGENQKENYSYNSQGYLTQITSRNTIQVKYSNFLKL